ncbi:winged helix-turn-helix domain-containing protein [Streptomyces roseolus]|uniref:winged helix-turn-helix domain-containing protein n=1 Tax=Streptomyces roseolus TaxID=67358 RepID=UPI00364A7649
MTKRSLAGDRTALYRYFDAEGNLLYLGITNDVQRRELQHRRDSARTWFPLIATRTQAWFETRSEAETAELAALATEAPPWNVKDVSRLTEQALVASRERKRVKRARVARGWSPAYRRYADEIIEQIESGALKPGDHVPSINKLAKAKDISISTASRVIQTLSIEGWVHPVSGYGSVVRSRP